MTGIKIDGRIYPVTKDNFGLCPSCSFTNKPEWKIINCKACGGHRFIPKLRDDYPDHRYYQITEEGFTLHTKMSKKKKRPPPKWVSSMTSYFD